MEPGAGRTITYTITTEYPGVWDGFVTEMMTSEGIDAGDYSTDTSVDGQFSVDMSNLDNVIIRSTVFQMYIR